MKADLFVEDRTKNLNALLACNVEVLCMASSQNRDFTGGPEAWNWVEAEDFIRDRYYSWRSDGDLSLPERPGLAPPGEKVRLPNDPSE